MGKINKLVVLIPFMFLFACSNSSSVSLNANEPLTYDVKIKDNTEFILVKEGTSVDEFTNNLESYLAIDTNADSYTIDWLGESLSTYDEDTLNEIDGKEAYFINGIDYYFDWDNLKTINVEEEVIASKETTLNYDSFRPIKLIIKFSKDGIEKTYYKQIILAVCKQEDYDVISSNNIKTIDEVYRKLDEIDGFTSNIKDYVQTSYSNGYTSNIRQK